MCCIELPYIVYSCMNIPDLFVAKMQVTVIYCAGEKCQQSMPNEVENASGKTNSCCSQQ